MRFDSVGIYGIQNRINEKWYVGRAVDIDRRWYHHRYDLANNTGRPNPHLQNAWNKYGADAFLFVVLELCEEATLQDRETFWINAIGYYNKTIFPPNTPAGQKRTPEQRQRMSEAQQKTPEWKAKISASLIGRKPTPEVRQKQAAGAIASGLLRRGRKYTDEHCAALVRGHAAQSHTVMLADGRKFLSQSHFARSFDLTQSMVSTALRRDGKTYDWLAAKYQARYQIVPF